MADDGTPRGPPPSGQASLIDKEHAGWRGEDAAPGAWQAWLSERRNPRWTEFSWLTVRTLLDSMNDVIAKSLDDLVNGRRMRWVAARRAAGVESDELATSAGAWPDMRSSMGLDGDFSCLVVGDPGEADGSQYAVAEALLAQAPGTRFMLIASDVIYPAGDVNDYENGFYLPFNPYRQAGDGARGHDRPILGVPGNHDWYDGLAGFMYHLCGSEPLPPTEYRTTSFGIGERFARALWRRASRPDRAALLAQRDANRRPGDPEWRPPQPGPYFCIDTGRVQLVCIDTGITGALDEEQGEWLRRVSLAPKDKLLITGKPIYVDGHYAAGTILWGADSPPLGPGGEALTVDDIVRDPAHRYVAAIGGDVHNYQHYEVADEHAPSGAFHYLVSGGGGAFLTATHRFAPVDFEGYGDEHVTEDDLVACYPTRGDSLVYASVHYLRTIRRWASWSLAPLAALLVCAITGSLGADLGGEAGHQLYEVLLVVGGTLVVAVVAGLGAAGVGHLAPSGYQLLARVCAAAGLLTVIAAGLAAAWPSWWADVWPLVVIAVSVVLIALGFVLGAYFARGAGPRFSGDLVISATVVGLACWALVNGLEANGAGIAAIVGGGVLALALGVPVLGRALDSGKPPVRRRPIYHRITSLLIVGGATALAIVIDHWVVWSAAVAAWGYLLVAAIGLWLVWIRWLGVRALVAVQTGTAPPESADELFALAADRFGRKVEAASPRANATPGWRARAIGDYLLGNVAGDHPLRWAQGQSTSEIGDGNEAPMFKSFLRLDVREDQLTVRCFGVSGWAVDAEHPPVEDAFVIELRPAG